jgi:hypothetical protein
LNDTANINGGSVTWSSGDGRSGGIAAGQMGPVRVGIFATSSGTRISSGAGYYGNMELSGNLAEPVVSVGRTQSLNNFQGTDGTGALNANGFATNADWPGYDQTNNAVDSTVGIGYRGGDFQSSNQIVYETSARNYAVKDPDSMSCAERYDVNCGVFQGGRLGRNAS